MAPSILSKASHPGSYIVCLASSSATSCAALATNVSSDDAIIFYKLSPAGFAHSSTLRLQGDRGAATLLRAINGSPVSGQSVYLTAHKQPGCVRFWDERQANPSMEIHSPDNRGILSFDVSSNILATGSQLQSDDASITYWDIRKTQAPVHTHLSTHSDDITAIHFHPNTSDILLSASADGLLSLSQTNEPDEDEAVTHVANWGCSIARACWFSRGNGQYGICAASDMETFGTWSEELDPLVEFGDIREIPMAGQKKIDYLIDVFDYSQTSGPYGVTTPMLYLGSNEGDISLASIPDILNSGKRFQLKEHLTNAHRDAVVRSVLYNKTNELLLTGDEEGRLNAWKIPNSPIDGDGDFKMDEEVPSSKLKRSREGEQKEVTKRGRYVE